MLKALTTHKKNALIEGWNEYLLGLAKSYYRKKKG